MVRQRAGYYVIWWCSETGMMRLSVCAHAPRLDSSSLSSLYLVR
jgi:hypothetical protein